MRHTANAAASVACAFLLLALLGRVLLRRALQPLRDIQAPLAQLAEGATDILVGTSPHREIAAITDGLATAAARIGQRDQHLNYLANHDSLTGLPNRHSFMSLLENKTHHGVMFVDLDQFKYVNDTLGHIAGDAILKQVAHRLKTSVGSAGSVARFGGDEFGVLISSPDEDCVALANRMMAGLNDYPFVYNNQSFTLSCSIGLLVDEDSLNQKSDDIVAQAGVACQKAKADGRNRVRIYAPEADAIAALRTDINWSQTLQYALKNNQFVLYYQPIVDLADDRTSHFEVLLRLRSETGLHAPGAFLGAAQRFGLMKDIDRWVIEHAFRSLAWYRRQDQNLRFTVNLSGGAFADGDLAEFVDEMLRTYKLDPRSVIFEITEQVAIGSFVDATAQILTIMDYGCEFALDDFGAGYSAFNYLKELPMQYVKIDGQFIRELHESKTDQLIVRAIADICKTLGKKTIAEFVEHEATLALLKDFGVDYAQGYLLGKPDEKLQSRERYYLDTIDEAKA
jgi:diguanylate cyclase (GGDEF)-like protein